MWLFIILLLVYVMCMFFNAFLSAVLHDVYKVELPVNVVCGLGFIGTFILFVAWVLIMDDPWNVNKKTIFYRIFNATKD